MDRIHAFVNKACIAFIKGKVSVDRQGWQRHRHVDSRGYSVNFTSHHVTGTGQEKKNNMSVFMYTFAFLVISFVIPGLKRDRNFFFTLSWDWNGTG